MPVSGSLATAGDAGAKQACADQGERGGFRNAIDVKRAAAIVNARHQCAAGIDRRRRRVEVRIQRDVQAAGATRNDIVVAAAAAARTSGRVEQVGIRQIGDVVKVDHAGQAGAVTVGLTAGDGDIHEVGEIDAIERDVEVNRAAGVVADLRQAAAIEASYLTSQAGYAEADVVSGIEAVVAGVAKDSRRRQLGKAIRGKRCGVEAGQCQASHRAGRTASADGRFRLITNIEFVLDGCAGVAHLAVVRSVDAVVVGANVQIERVCVSRRAADQSGDCCDQFEFQLHG